MGSRGGGFRPSDGLVRRGFLSEIPKLTQDINSDETISDITKKELTDQLGTTAGASASGGVADIIKSAKATLNEARAGGGKFAGRQIQSKQRSLLADRPGRAQTILTR